MHRVTLAHPVTALAVAASLVLGACGGAAATPAPTQAPATAAPTTAPTVTPTATPAPTPSPTEAPTPAPTEAPTEAPTPDATQAPSALFAFAPADVIGYYQGLGFTCNAAATVATGFTGQQCFKAKKKTPTAMVSVAWSTADGVTHYGYAGYYNANGAKKPNKTDAYTHLGGFIGAMLGNDNGTVVGQWVSSNVGVKVQDTFGGLMVYSYPLDKNPGSGYFFEIATPDIIAALQGG